MLGKNCILLNYRRFMQKKVLLIVLILLFQTSIKFKENPLDPTTPTGIVINSLNDHLSSQNNQPSQNNQLKRVFVSQMNTNGNIAVLGVPGSNAIQKVDYICNTEFYKPITSSSFKAMIVDGVNRRACITPNCTDPNENIDWVFKPNTDYYTYHGGGYLFTTNSAGIVLGEINQITSSSSSAFYWTGLGSDWTNSPTNCNNWTDYTGAGVIGVSTAKNSSWYSHSTTLYCYNSVQLLCVEQ